MGSVATYSFLNAKTFALMSSFITPKSFLESASSRDIQECLSKIKNYGYDRLFSEITQAGITEKGISSSISEEELRYILRLIKFSRKPIKDLLYLFVEQTKIENLKSCLRAVHSGEPSSAVITKFPFAETNPIPYEAVLACQTIDQAAQLLSKTPYKLPLNEAMPNYKKDGALFWLEISLDKDWHSRTAACIKGLQALDQKMLKKLLGTYMDICVMKQLIRYKRWYDLPAGDIDKYIPLTSCSINEKEIKQAYSSEKVINLASKFSRLPNSVSFLQEKEKSVSVEKLAMLEQLLWHVLLMQCRSALSSFPFHAGVITASVLLKKIECQNLRTVLLGVFFSMPAEEIKSMLILEKES